MAPEVVKLLRELGKEGAKLSELEKNAFWEMELLKFLKTNPVLAPDLDNILIYGDNHKKGKDVFLETNAIKFAAGLIIKRGFVESQQSKFPH